MSGLLFYADLGTCTETTYRWLTIHLVGTINAIVLTITTEYFRYTIFIFTLELIVSTFGQRSTHFIGFIFVIFAIVDAIAKRRFAYTLEIGAFKGIRMTMYMGTCLITLITAIGTIVPAITLPTGHDTFAIAACEVIRGTGTVDFITAIGTIIIAITLVLPKENMVLNRRFTIGIWSKSWLTY